MSTTLSYGYKLPEDGDFGSTWFDDLEFNISRVNGHSHDGSDSPKLTPTAISKLKQTTTAASGANWTAWSATSGKTDVYEKTITLPSTITGLSSDNTIDDYCVILKDASGNQLDLTINKTSSTTFTVYANDNTLALDVFYVT